MQGETDEEILKALYDFCQTGYQFEHFLALILGALGLEDVRVTQASKDGGVDLTATRAGIDGLSNADHTKYRVQAKRLKPGTAASITDIRALRGILKSGEAGLFITTGRFTSSAEAFLDHDDSRPILLIDGPRIVDLCKAHQIGISFYPYFDATSLAVQMKSTVESTASGPTKAGRSAAPVGERAESSWAVSVSVNDVRARILPIPKEILDQIELSAEPSTLSLTATNQRPGTTEQGAMSLA